MHLVFNSQMLRCKVFGPGGDLWKEIEMHDAAVNEGFGHWGRVPRGFYSLSKPVPHDHPAFGRWFIPLVAVPGRDGIGIHGGGSGLPDPFAPRQGWVVTHGCLRVQNEDLEWLAQKMRKQPGPHQITVGGP